MDNKGVIIYTKTLILNDNNTIITQSNIVSKLQNPSNNKPINHENYNKSTKNDLISQWAGSDSNQRPPPCQGGILTRLDHRPLYYNY